MDAVVTVEWRRMRNLDATLKQGKDFLHAYEVLTAYNKDCHPAENEDKKSITYARFANLAFSIELFLKALHFAEGTRKKGHDLKKLFEALSSDRQRQIMEKVRSVNPTVAQGSETFDGMLARHADAFERWRYFHEVGFGRFTNHFCESLAYSLVEVAQQLHAELVAIVVKQDEQGLIKLPEA